MQEVRAGLGSIGPTLLTNPAVAVCRLSHNCVATRHGSHACLHSSLDSLASAISEEVAAVSSTLATLLADGNSEATENAACRLAYLGRVSAVSLGLATCAAAANGVSQRQRVLTAGLDRGLNGAALLQRPFLIDGFA